MSSVSHVALPFELLGPVFHDTVTLALQHMSELDVPLILRTRRVHVLQARQQWHIWSDLLPLGWSLASLALR